MTHPPLSWPVLAVGVLVAWRMVGRMRRLIGRQPSVAWRHWMAAVLFPVLLVLVGAAGLGGPAAASAGAALAGGALAGAALAAWGLRTTRFEATPQGLFYTPNARIGIALSLLLAGRIGYRLWDGGAGLDGSGDPVVALGHSPWTLLIFATLAGYYAAYAAGLLRWRRRVARAGAPS